MSKRIIVLEDDLEIRELVEYLLREENFEVRGFENVGDFWEAMNSTRPDLYLLDVMLPDGNGLEVCKALKSDEATQHIPVIIMSAHFSSAMNECAAEDFIGKPFDINRFVATVRRYIA